MSSGFAHRRVLDLFRPQDPDFIRDPYPAFTELRTLAPVFWHEDMQSWVATRYDDCRRILADWDVFASDYRRVGMDEPDANISIQTIDQQDHARVHGLLVAAMKGIERSDTLTFVRDQVNRLLAGFQGQSRVDLVSSYQVPLALSVISRVIGATPAPNDQLMGQSADIVSSMIAGLQPSTLGPGMDARAALTKTISETWMPRAPNDSVLGYLRDISKQEVSPPVWNSVRVLLLAGVNSMQRFLGNALVALLHNDSARAQLAEFPIVSRAMTLGLNELVRLETPFHAQQKVCTIDVELGSQSLRRGDLIVALVGSANRDERQFRLPETIDLARDPNPHLGFGYGPHSCLGAYIALLEARVAIPALFAHYPKIRLASDPVYEPNATLRGLHALDVELGSPVVPPSFVMTS